jgi:GDP-L-fucose synthase
MPTNLYGPNDNYNLETSHVLPALIRKIHLGKCLENNDWEAIRKDLKKYPVEGISDTATELEIIEKLAKFGIQYSKNTPLPASRSPLHISITLWGTGNPYREFLYVEDLADACIFLMQNIDFKDLMAFSPGLYAQRSTPYADLKNTHINIGIGRDLTIKELAMMIKNIIGFEGQLVWDSSKPDGTPRKLLDVSKINKLGWKEKIGLEEGIGMVYNKYLA